MSQEAVERLLGRLITDRQFRDLAFTTLEVACVQEGYRLSPSELVLLADLPMRRMEELGALLHAGLCRVARVEPTPLPRAHP